MRLLISTADVCGVELDPGDHEGLLARQDNYCRLPAKATRLRQQCDLTLYE